MSRGSGAYRSVRAEARPEELEFWPTCEACSAFARWAIGSAEDGDLNSATTSAFACRSHLSHVLERDDTALDGMDIGTIIDLFEHGREW